MAALLAMTKKTQCTFIILEVQGIFLVGDDLFHVNDALVVELSQNFYFSYGCDWEALLFIIKTNLLQSHHFSFSTEKQTVRATSCTHTPQM